jgi:hypothetical protein
MTSSNSNQTQDNQGQGGDGTGAPPPNDSYLEIRSLDSHVVRAPRYVVRDWRGLGVFPVGGTIVAGKQGSGKSTFLRKILSDFTTGQGSFQGDRVGEVLYTCWEDEPESSILPQVAVNGGDPSKVKFLTGVRQGAVSRQWQFDDLQRIRQYCETNAETRIIVVDTLTALSNTIGRNTRSAQAAGAITAALHQLGLELGLAVVIVCHLTKLSRRGGALDAIAGSTQLTSGPRAVWLVGHHPSNEAYRSMSLLKHNLTGMSQGCTFTAENVPIANALEMIRLRGLQTEGDLPQSMFLRTDILREEAVPLADAVFAASVNRAGQTQPSALDRAVEILRQILQENQGNISTRVMEGQLATAGFSTATISRARNFLSANGEIRTFQSGREHFVCSASFDHEAFIARRRAESDALEQALRETQARSASRGPLEPDQPPTDQPRSEQPPPGWQFPRFIDL